MAPPSGTAARGHILMIGESPLPNREITCLRLRVGLRLKRGEGPWAIVSYPDGRRIEYRNGNMSDSSLEPNDRIVGDGPGAALLLKDGGR